MAFVIEGTGLSKVSQGSRGRPVKARKRMLSMQECRVRVYTPARGFEMNNHRLGQGTAEIVVARWRSRVWTDSSDATSPDNFPNRSAGL